MKTLLACLAVVLMLCPSTHAVLDRTYIVNWNDMPKYNFTVSETFAASQYLHYPLAYDTFVLLMGFDFDHSVFRAMPVATDDYKTHVVVGGISTWGGSGSERPMPFYFGEPYTSRAVMGSTYASLLVRPFQDADDTFVVIVSSAYPIHLSDSSFVVENPSGETSFGGIIGDTGETFTLSVAVENFKVLTDTNVWLCIGGAVKKSVGEGSIPVSRWDFETKRRRIPAGTLISIVPDISWANVGVICETR